MWFSKNLTSCKKVHLWAIKNKKLKRKRKQKSKEKNVWFALEIKFVLKIESNARGI